jgi:hypothetical protein
MSDRRGNRLTCFCFEVLIPVMVPAVANKYSTALLNLADQFLSLHKTCNSAWCRTAGISPEDKSL